VRGIEFKPQYCQKQKQKTSIVNQVEYQSVYVSVYNEFDLPVMEIEPGKT
jgi:hypothetical protein